MRLKRRIVAAAAAVTLATGIGIAGTWNAQAATVWTDTSLQTLGSHALTCTPPGVVAGAKAAANVVTFTAVGGTTFSDAGLSSLTGGFDGTLTPAPSSGLITVTGVSEPAATAVLTFKITEGGCVGVETVTIAEAAAVLTPATPAIDVVTAITWVNNNTTGAVDFSATSTTASNTEAFTEGNLPSGLVSGSPSLVPGSAVPRTGFNAYDNLTVKATDSAGAVATNVFNLHVFAHRTHVAGNRGDEVNGFGNGFDVWQRHWVYNQPVVGWTATKGDPATHFIRIFHGTNVQFEAVDTIGATGLCVSDPGAPDLLVLRICNNGPWQQFKLLTAEPSQLQDIATGLVVWPNGTGVQLRGSAVPLGGDSHYTWKDISQLP